MAGGQQYLNDSSAGKISERKNVVTPREVTVWCSGIHRYGLRMVFSLTWCKLILQNYKNKTPGPIVQPDFCF